MCNVSTIGDETLDCMLSGACDLPVDCNFSVAAAVGYLAPDWSHDLDTAPVVQTTDTRCSCNSRGYCGINRRLVAGRAKEIDSPPGPIGQAR